jgi:hypothetical protein
MTGALPALSAVLALASTLKVTARLPRVRRIERAAPQPRLAVGEIVEAAGGERIADLDRHAFARALRGRDHERAAVAAAQLGNLDDGRQRVDVGSKCAFCKR